MKLVWSEEIHKCTLGKGIKIPPNISHTIFLKKWAIDIQEARLLLCVCVLLFPFTAVTNCSVALTWLFTGYTCKTQSHLQREISRAAVNRRVNVMVLVSSPKQNADFGTPATWQDCVSPLQPFIVRFHVRISSPIDHTCQKSVGLLLPLRNAAYISCIQRGQYVA